MGNGWGERIVWLLDRCWPFPLGIVATTLALLMTTGIWLAIRGPQPRPVGRPLGQTGSTKIPAQVPSSLPPPTQNAAPAAAREASPGAIPIGPETSGRVATPERMGTLAPSSTSREISPPTKVAVTATLAKPPVKQPKVQRGPVAPKLSATQQAEISDRLTIGRFLMDRKEYSAAIKEFQTALAIDPASREAQAAIQKARAAGKY